MPDQITQLMERFVDLFTAGLLSVFGGTAAYVYKTVREDTGFKFSSFLVNAFLAFFIGNMVGGFIAKDASYRDGILMLAGFSTWPILHLVEFYGKKFVMKYISKEMGLDIDIDISEESDTKRKIAEAELALAKAEAELKALRDSQPEQK